MQTERFPAHPVLNCLVKEVHLNVQGDVPPHQISFQLYLLKEAHRNPIYEEHKPVVENWIDGVGKKLLRAVNKTILTESERENLVNLRMVVEVAEDINGYRAVRSNLENKIAEL